MNNLRKIIALVAAVLILHLASYPVQAAERSMRCGGYLIHGGSSRDSALMYEVLRKCGEPHIKQGNTWIYKQGGMDRVLTFNYEGRLQLIESRRN